MLRCWTSLHTFPAHQGIRHLVLTSLTADFTLLSAGLAALAQLQTLSLSTGADATWWQITQLPKAGRLHLHLAPLQHLCSVHLTVTDIMPDSITLRDSCDLHLTLFEKWSAVHAVWDNVLPSLRSVRLSCRHYSCRALPSILSLADNLVTAELHLNSFGTRQALLRLSGAIAHVKELYLCCSNGLHAIMPALVSWQKVTLAGTQPCSLTFESAETFAATVPASCFFFPSERVGTRFCGGFACLGAGAHAREQVRMRPIRCMSVP